MPIVSGRFDREASATAKVWGMPDLRFVVVPRIYRNLSVREGISQTEEAFDVLVRELTTNGDGHGRVGDELPSAGGEHFEGDDQLDALSVMNQEYLNRNWGDGFPLLPATPKAVERMLEGTNLPPEYVLCDLPPGYGLATVEKIAINAAMAGALPEHMPIIIGAVKAVSQLPTQHARSFLTNTSAVASMLLVNGPIAKELGINSKAACMGPGGANRANLAIGRAYTLCLKNIGHWYPGLADMNTIGTVRKFTVCIAENEDMTPWEPFHVEKGFRVEDSVVTLLGSTGEVDVCEMGNNTAEDLLKTVAFNAIFHQWDLPTCGQHGFEHSPRDTIVLMPPDLIRPVAAGGFTKRAAKEFIHHHARSTLGKMTHFEPLLNKEKVDPQWRWLVDLSERERDEISMPIRESADRYHLICVGADRAKPLIIPSKDVPPQSVNVDQYRPDR